MTSALLLNIGGAIVFVGIWTAAVVHVYHSLAADERRASGTGGQRRLRSPKVIPGPVSPAGRALAS